MYNYKPTNALVILQKRINFTVHALKTDSVPMNNNTSRSIKICTMPFNFIYRNQIYLTWSIFCISESIMLALYIVGTRYIEHFWIWKFAFNNFLT
jgi:hypothetical protein